MPLDSFTQPMPRPLRYTHSINSPVLPQISDGRKFSTVSDLSSKRTLSSRSLTMMSEIYVCRKLVMNPASETNRSKT